MGSFQEIRVEDGPYEHHAHAKIHIYPFISNLEHGGQQFPPIPQTANPELEDGMGFRPVHLLVPLPQSVVGHDLLRRRQLQRPPGTRAIQSS